MAVVDFFLKLDGIEGESQDSKHKNEIDIESWSSGRTNSGDAGYRGGDGVGKVNFRDMHLTMRINKASPKLFEACATGKHVKSGVLTARKAGGEQQEYLKITLSDLIVASYEEGGHPGSVVPTDQFSLNYSKIEIEYKEQKPDGSLGGTVKAGYDVKQNKKV